MSQSSCILQALLAFHDLNRPQIPWQKFVYERRRAQIPWKKFMFGRFRAQISWNKLSWLNIASRASRILRALDAHDDLGRLRRPQSLNTYKFLFQNLTKLQLKIRTNSNAETTCCKDARLYGKTRVKCIKKECRYVRIPCFPVCFTNVLIFTVFYRVKCVFRGFANLLGFYRVNRITRPKKDLQMDPKMGPGSLTTRVLPRF